MAGGRNTGCRAGINTVKQEENLMKRRIVSGLLCSVMLLGLLGGCGSSSQKNQASGVASTEGNASGGETLEDDLSQEVTFSYWLPAQDYKVINSMNEHPFVRYLNDKFNVTIEFQQPAIGSEADNFNLMMGTGDYADIMEMTYNTTALSTLYEDGVIIDLAPYIEKYMPNYWNIIQSNEEIRKVAYDDEGHIFKILQLEDPERNQWGGLVYRRDILETMTGGNVQFPSGNDEPTTVEDWDYMLPLFKQYFEAAGMPDYACLIIPAIGYTATGEIQNGWGATGTFGLDTDLKTVQYGPATDYFYNYVEKMNEWYEEGYIYKDFASRTNDLFYMPNTSLTYGGAAGAWFGILQQVGDYMNVSGDGYSLEFDVRAATGPLDTEHGVKPEMAGTHVAIENVASYRCISSGCSEEKLARILTVMDYLYSEEGDLLASRGLKAEQAANDPVYQQLGMEDGVWWENEDGTWSKNPNFIEKAGDYAEALQGFRISCGTGKHYEGAENDRTSHSDDEDAAADVWVSYPNDRAWLSAYELNAEENAVYAKYYTGINDYVNTMIPKFIMGTEELTPESWDSYKQQLESLGLNELIAAYQSAYDRYLAK